MVPWLKNPISKVIAVMCAFNLICPYAFAQEVGRVTSVQGMVDVTGKDASSSAQLREGDAVSLGDAVRTKSQSKVEITFADKTVVRLAQNSRVIVEDYQIAADGTRKRAEIKLERGKARTVIAKMKEPADFVITTPNAQGTVKGSDIFAFYQAGNSGMLVADGKLSVINAALPDQQVMIPSGNSVVVSLDEAPKGPRPFMDLEKKIHESDTNLPAKPKLLEGTVTIRGTATKASGTVLVTPKGAAQAHPVQINEVLNVGDKVETKADGMVEIRLDNGNIITLKPNTVIEILTLSVNTKTGEYTNEFFSSNGMIRGRVENLKGKSSFTVKTPSAICGARGTIMYVGITPTSLRAFYEGGSGFLQSLISGLEETVADGYNAAASGDGSISGPVITTDQERLEWQEGWNPGSGVEGYSSPEGGVFLSSDDTGGLSILGGADLGAPETGGTGFFGDLPFGGGGTTLTVEEEPLTAYGNFFGETSYNDSWTGDLEGVFGLTRSFWNNSQATFVSLGDYLVNPEYFGEPLLWLSQIFSYNPEIEKYMTYDGGAFYGIGGGTGVNGVMDGSGVFVYIDAQGNGGVATGDLAGLYSIGASSYLLAGNLTGQQLVSAGDLGIVAEDLFDSLYITEGEGLLSGSFDGQGWLTADEDFITLSLVNEDNGVAQDWGIYSEVLYGEFEDGESPSSVWSATIGGEDAFGAYYQEGEGNGYLSDDYGYWIAFIEDGRWSGGTLDGILDGYFLTPTKMGSIFGDIFGQYGYDEEAGYWLAVGQGVWDGDPLTFSGGWNTGGGELSGLYYNDDGEASWTGEECGYIGSTVQRWWEQEYFPILAMGEYIVNLYIYSGPEPYLWNSPLRSYNALEYNNTTMDNGAFDGYSSGVWNEGNMTGAIAALFADNEGRVGFLRGLVSGGYYADLGYDRDYYDYGMWMVTGTLYPTLDPSDSGLIVDPANLEYYKWYGGGTGDLAGTFGGNPQSQIVASDTMRTVSLYDPDGSIACPWGIFTQSITGAFTGKPYEDTTWSAKMGGFDSFGCFYNDETSNFSDDEAYWLCVISGTWKLNGEIYGTMTGTYLSENYLGLNGIEGSLFGANNGYAEGTWIGSSVGSWQGAPLSFAGYSGYQQYDSLYRDFDGSRDGTGREFGFIGSTEENWWENPFDVVALGEYRDYDYSEPYIWDTPWYGNSSRTEERGDFQGYSAGVWANGIMTGAVACLFANPDGVVGFFRGLLSGAYYMFLDNEYMWGMWMAQGELTPTLDTSELRIDLPYFGSYIWDGGGTGDLVGSFEDESGFIQATDYLETQSFYDYESGIACPWGIFRQEITGYFSGKPSDDTAWSAHMGGYDSFGAYYDDGYFYSDYGYWLTDVSGNWSANGEITGSIIGTYLTQNFLGLNGIEGDLFGVSNGTGEGTWIGTSVGSWQGIPLTLAGYWDYDSLYQNDGGDFDEVGYEYGFIGSIEENWWENPFDIVALGEYEDREDSEPYIWDTPCYGNDDKTETRGTFQGYTAGVWSNGIMKGAIACLFANPSGVAGFFAGLVSGAYYPFGEDDGIWGMWMAQGTLTPTLDPSESGIYVDPDNLESYIWPGYGTGELSGSYAEGAGNIQATDYLQTQSFYDSDEGIACPWGIFTQDITGTFSGKPSVDTTWSAHMGGYDSFGAYYDGGYFYDDEGYWLTDVSGNWTANGEVTGIITGTYLTRHYLGFNTIEGNLFGVNSTLDETWIGSSVGSWQGLPLTLSADVEGAFGYYDLEDEDLYMDYGSLYAYFGSTDDLWDGPANAVFVGAFDNDDEYALWGTDLTGETADGGAVFMSMGGISLRNALHAGLVGMFIRPDPENQGSFLAGYIISDDIAGEFCPGIGIDGSTGMFWGAGTINAVDCGETEFSPEELLSSEPPIDFHDFEGDVSGDISGTLDGEDVCLYDQDWGILRMGMGGDTHTDPGNDWGAVLGGIDFDEYLEQPSNFWICVIDGTLWEDNMLAGTLEGYSIDYYTLCTCWGNTIGVYDPEGWEALSLGVTVDEELSFVSDLIDTTKNEGDGFFYSHYDPSEDVLEYVHAGDMTGLLGGVESLWEGSATAHFMGAYELDTGAEYLAWTGKTWSHNYYEGSDTTYDNGSFAGLIGGVVQNTDYANPMNGLAELFFINPDGIVGVISGALFGDAYANLGMFNLRGDLTLYETITIGLFSVTPGDIGIDPEDLLRSIDGESNFECRGMKELDEDRTLYAELDGMSLFLVNYSGEEPVEQDWGIWGIQIIGAYTESPDNRIPGTWELPFAGLSSHQSKGYGGSQIDGSVLGQLDVTSWGNHMIEGTSRGIFLSLKGENTLAGGVFAGDVTGNYVDVEEGVGTWQAVAAGEWAEAFEIEQALDITQIDSMVSDLRNLVNIPIDVAFSVTNMPGAGSFGAGGSISASMDMSFYAIAQNLMNGIWAAVINGTYNTPTDNSWSVSFDQDGYSATLIGTQWDENQWQANVEGSTTDGTSFTGAAEGTYTDPTEEGQGTFTGVGTGEWNRNTGGQEVQ